MKTIQLKNTSVDVITSMSELSVSDLEKCIKNFNAKEKDNIERYIDLLTILTPMSTEEVEDLDIDDFKILAELIDVSDFDIKSKVFINKIEVDGIKYMTKSDGTSYSFNVKEVFSIQKYLKNEEYILYFAAIIFRPVDENGKISNDFSNEEIMSRKELFKNINVDVVLPYLMSLSKFIIDAK